MLCKVNVVIEKDEYGYYAYCPELEGCQTQGDTLEEALDNIKEAVELYLETLSELKIELRQLSRDEESHLEGEFENYELLYSKRKPQNL